MTWFDHVFMGALTQPAGQLFGFQHFLAYWKQARCLEGRWPHLAVYGVSELLWLSLGEESQGNR